MRLIVEFKKRDNMECKTTYDEGKMCHYQTLRQTHNIIQRIKT